MRYKRFGLCLQKCGKAYSHTGKAGGSPFGNRDVEVLIMDALARHRSLDTPKGKRTAIKSVRSIQNIRYRTLWVI